MDNSVDDIEIQEPEEERVYSARERALRDYFVEQYLIDYDPVASAIRCGYGKSFAKEYAARFMAEPYVMRAIQKAEGTTKENGESDIEAERKRIIAGLKREAHYRGPGSSQAARVAALAKLATLFEMDPKDKKPENDKNELEGTFVTPGVMSPEQWAEAAARQQTELVAGTQTPTTPVIH